MKSPLCFVLVLMAALAEVPTRANEFIPLGHIPNARHFSFPYDVSGDGRVVVGLAAYSSESLDVQAFRWTADSGMQRLGFATQSGFESIATSSSIDGTTVVGSSTSSNGEVPFEWNPNDGMRPISSSALSNRLCAANDVSANGQIIVGSACGDVGGAATWSRETGLTQIGALPGGDSRSMATAVSNDGQTVVGFASGEFGTQAFRWNMTTGLVGIGDLDGGEFHSIATGISSDGDTIVGGSSSSRSDSVGGEAFRWTEREGMVALGDLPGGSFHSAASDVSANGRIIVGVANSHRDFEAFVWDEQNGMRSVYDIVANDATLRDRVEGWTFHGAVAISNDGRTIVGDGTNARGEREGWLVRLDPLPVPEPAAFALAVIGALTMCIYGAQRRRMIARK